MGLSQHFQFLTFRIIPVSELTTRELNSNP